MPTRNRWLGYRANGKARRHRRKSRFGRQLSWRRCVVLAQPPPARLGQKLRKLPLRLRRGGGSRDSAFPQQDLVEGVEVVTRSVLRLGQQATGQNGHADRRSGEQDARAQWRLRDEGPADDAWTNRCSCGIRLVQPSGRDQIQSSPLDLRCTGRRVISVRSSG